MAPNLKRTTLRIPQDLYDRILEAAGEEHTYNSVVTSVLQEAFPKPVDRDTPAVLNALRREIEDAGSIEKKRDLISAINQDLRNQADGTSCEFLLLDDGLVGLRLFDDFR